MKVRELIMALLEDEDISMDDDVEIYVSGRTEAVEECLKDAKKHGYNWCFDDNLPIEEIENRGGHIWLHAEELQY